MWCCCGGCGGRGGGLGAKSPFLVFGNSTAHQIKFLTNTLLFHITLLFNLKIERCRGCLVVWVLGASFLGGTPSNMPLLSNTTTQQFRLVISACPYLLKCLLYSGEDSSAVSGTVLYAMLRILEIRELFRNKSRELSHRTSLTKDEFLSTVPTSGLYPAPGRIGYR
jgi:hypothetical protein